MAKLIWDTVGKRIYETGLDRGVLYLPDGSAVPWNGLTSIVERFNKETSSVYYDGKKINEFVVVGEFSASMRAVTYPDEFLELEGLGFVRNGVYVGDQQPKLFGLSYRTRIGNDLEGDEAGYKIHIIYNLTAIPHEKTYASMSVNPSLNEFEWDIVAIPEDFLGFRPTSHMIIDSREFDPWLLEELEEMLYGGDFAEAALIPMSELVTYIKTWYRYRIFNNNDGTWTVTSSHPSAIQFTGIAQQIFDLIGAYIVYLDDITFKIFDTYDISDSSLINIIDNGDGTWTATTQHDGLVVEGAEGFFQINNANAVMVGIDEYELSDTKEEA